MYAERDNRNAMRGVPTMPMIDVTQQAPPGDQFAPYAFNHEIGKAMSVSVGGRVITSTILDAWVSEDGSQVTFTIDVPIEIPAGAIRPQ
jgi:hypothetical protein